METSKVIREIIDYTVIGTSKLSDERFDFIASLISSYSTAYYCENNTTYRPNAKSTAIKEIIGMYLSDISGKEISDSTLDTMHYLFSWLESVKRDEARNE